VRRIDILRAEAAAILGALSISAATALVGWWQPTTAPASARPSAILAIAAVALACAIVSLLAQAAWLASALQDEPLLQRASALRRKSWNAVYQRQLNPDAPGHARPRAPSAVPAAA